MIGAVLAVFLLAYVDLRREQARALEDFTAEQSALARSFAGTVAARMGGVLKDLDAAAELASSSALEHLLLANPSYRGVALLDDGGAPLVEARPRAGAAIATSALLQDTRARLAANLSDGELAISPPLPPSLLPSSMPSSVIGERLPHERLRLFGMRRGPRRAVLLVDTSLFFEGLRGASGAPTCLLVVDDARRSLELRPANDGVLSWQATDRRPSSEVGALLANIGAAKSGAVLLSRSAADSLGLGQRTAVAGFAPVVVAHGPAWSIAVVASAMRVRDRARMAAWRLGAATGLAALLVALFGLLVSRQQRREQRLAAALQLAEATSALRERSEKMIEAIPIGVLALDAALRVTSANPYLIRRGVAAHCRLADSLPHATADELAILQALISEARENRRPLERMGLRLHFGADEARDVDAYAIPLGLPLPDVDCFVVLHDRTEMRILERNLIRAEKLGTIGTLAAGVAHEVGTPLGIISGRAEQLLTRIPEGEAQEAMRKGVASILSQVDKVSTTIRQLLDFARKRPIEADVITPAQAIGSAAALLEHRFRHCKVALELDAPASVASVVADPGQLEQVLVNLLVNACDACAAGGHVSVRASELRSEVALEVIDDGAGIAAEHLSSVLDPFFTTKKRGQGTGLGLTIAADIVKNHGGRLEIDSIVGRGTTVRVLLPKARPDVHGPGSQHRGAPT
jgi:signal transduction histidine kinase